MKFEGRVNDPPNTSCQLTVVFNWPTINDALALWLRRRCAKHLIKKVPSPSEMERLSCDPIQCLMIVDSVVWLQRS